jgi:hypothetical protein
LIGSTATKGLTSADLAHAVTETLVERPLFCDLLNHVTMNLEREVTYERVRAFKFTVAATLAPLTEAITRASALTAEQANNLIIAVISMTAPLWQAAHPGGNAHSAVRRGTVTGTYRDRLRSHAHPVAQRIVRRHDQRPW